MTESSVKLFHIRMSDVKLTGISRNGCAIVSAFGWDRVLISRQTFARLLNEPGCCLTGMIEPFTPLGPHKPIESGKSWFALKVLKM